MIARDLSITLASLVVLAGWLGAALLVVLSVAPAAFAVLPTRALAGALVGRVLPVLFWSGMIIGVTLGVLGWSSPNRFARIVAAIALAGACATAEFVVTPRIAQVRAQAGGAIDALGPSDPRRREFGRLHGISVAMLGIAGLSAMLALYFSVRDVPFRSAP
ncbi:MAG: DUF4149 domain-containing protein [Gemmatimonadaceae bacterium]|nr:DUF4149 domain-containing protein [Gemmatimonadaceae bacterium]